MNVCDQLDDNDLYVLELLEEHGTLRFSAARDLSSTQKLFDLGLITDTGTGVKRITPAGKATLKRAAKDFP
jgi:hypothetical protein